MAKAAKIAWGIDVGNCTLKAIKLGMGDEGAEVLDFAVIEHKKILSQPDVTAQKRTELVISALRKFLDEHEVDNSAVVVSVPGHSSFARFIKLPPVESKRVPELVRYEAIQQIPFEIEDVEWDWQTFQTQDVSEILVGIFAIKRDLVRQALEPFTEVGCMINTVQMAPMSLYNFLRYDQKHLQRPDAKEAIVTLDIGAENTDLVIADGMRVWQRSIPIGGNQFTAAVQKAFKLSFTKAEAIKRTARTSKHARQIFQAMRSVFADLAAEIQRSLGFYSSGNRDAKFREVIALGNAMKLPGLIKFLQQSLSMPVKRLDSFDSLQLTSDVSASQFATHLPTMGVAYGLALQGIGQTTITSNLLPREVIRQTQWKRKKNWFVAACAIFVLAGMISFFKSYAQHNDIVSDATSKSRASIKQSEKTINQNKSMMGKYQGEIQTDKAEIDRNAQLYSSRNLIPTIIQALQETLPNAKNNPEQRQLYKAFNDGDPKAVRASIKRSLREQVFIHSMQIVYTENINQEFDLIAKKSTVRASRGGSGMMGSEGMRGLEGMMGPEGFGGGMSMFGMGGPQRGGGRSARGAGADKAAESLEAVPGFIVILEGTTTHKNELSFLCPPEVGIDRQKWGFFNRLEYMGHTDKDILAQAEEGKELSGAVAEPKKPSSDKPTANILTNDFQRADSEVAGELPFKTYIGPGDRKFSFDTSEGGWVSGTSQADQPLGIGITKPEEPVTATRVGGSTLGMGRPASAGRRTTVNQLTLLIDPLTFETISNEYQIDPDTGEIKLDAAGEPILERNDYWFRVKVKIKMKDTDKTSSEETGVVG